MLNTKQYLIEFGISIILYTIAIFYSISFLSSNPDTPSKIWISLLPVIPAIMVVIAVVRGLTRLDELQQHIQIKSLAISFAVVGLTTFSYGFLENVGYPHIPYIWIFPFMIAIWGVATLIVASTYK